VDGGFDDAIRLEIGLCDQRTIALELGLELAGLKITEQQLTDLLGELDCENQMSVHD
jgi:hypothetical protein